MDGAEELGARSLAGRLLILAVVIWGMSQGIDAVLNEEFGWTIVPEELLEMAGSTMFGLSMLVALRDVIGAPVRADRAVQRPQLDAQHTLQPVH